ncbi:LCP family protein [Streptacidiphilus anmyonensis]|uniref:LCP family protein n=1 Tax=Streptacidiphilus anmyonensis TaxID=405782 RepID=UPI00069340CC|nr:LytR C-terminal domain-containing protein [Streptacidiphilus anmyonensis]
MSGTADRRGPGGYEQAYQDPYTGEWVFPSQQPGQAPQSPQPPQEQQPYGQAQGYQQPYQAPQAQQTPQAQQPYGGYQQEYDPYAGSYDPYAGYQQQPQDPYYGQQQGYQPQSGYQQAAQPQQHAPQQAPQQSFSTAYQQPYPEQPPAEPEPPAQAVPPRQRPPRQEAPTARSEAVKGAGPSAGPGAGAGAKSRYNSEEFEFVDDAEESTDVIDWVKFSETRGERRDERRRKLRGRAVAVVVALVLVAGGGVGYLFATGKIGSGASTAVPAATKREVIAVHLHDLNKNVYSALLISEPSPAKGVTLLLPGTLGVPQDSGNGLLALDTAVDSLGAYGTRTGINNLLGTDISATWNIQTPFLQNLVDLLGGVKINSDVAVSLGGKQVISPGQNTAVNGAAAMAFATYKAKGESDQAQLNRFGVMLQALITAMPTDPTAAAANITHMGAVEDPSLSDNALGALLAKLSTDARGGSYSTETLPVLGNGTLGSGAGTMVSGLLAGKVSSESGQTAPRVQVIDASGNAKAAEYAQAAITNSGDVVVPGTAKAATRSTSVIEYGDDTRLSDAKALAATLGLPASAVKKVTSPLSVDLVAELGRDYKASA